MLICFRALAAVGSSAVMSLGAGTISDIYVPEQRGRAIGMYTLGPLIGPAVGPIIGGYLTQGFGWRSIFWFLTVLTAILWVLLFFWLPETWRAPVKEELPINDADKQAPPRKKRVNPIQSLALLRFPNMAVIVTYVAFM
jgi:MFS family permease